MSESEEFYSIPWEKLPSFVKVINELSCTVTYDFASFKVFLNLIYQEGFKRGHNQAIEDAAKSVEVFPCTTGCECLEISAKIRELKKSC